MRDPWMVRGARRAMTTLALLLAVSGAARAQEPTTAKAPDWKLDSETFEGLRARVLGKKKHRRHPERRNAKSPAPGGAGASIIQPAGRLELKMSR